MTAVRASTPSLEDLFLLCYCLLDDLYHDLVPQAVQERPGHERMTLSDSEVLTLSLMQEALSLDSETAFLRFVRRNYAGLFPGLLERSRYHRRRKALLEVQRLLFAQVAQGFQREAAWFVVDSAPVETTALERSQTGSCSIAEAAYGIRPSRRQLFFGFRLHVLITDQGAIVEFALAPANEAEREMAEAMLGSVSPSETALVLADNNYSGLNMRQAAARHGHRVWASPKRSKPALTTEAARWRRWLRGKRVLVETVFAMLADQFRVETTRARSLRGVQTRLVAKLLAFDLSLWINQLLGRPPLAIKSLYL
jgi:hypothetical protein